jgi:hypothetical protein
MDKTKEFLYFIDRNEGKVLAIKVTEQWKDCQIFIYDMKSGKVDVYEDKGIGSEERRFFAEFIPNIDSVKTKMIGNEKKILTWEWLDRPSPEMWMSINDAIEEKANAAKMSTTWKDTFEYWLTKTKKS